MECSCFAAKFILAHRVRRLSTFSQTNLTGSISREWKFPFVNTKGLDHQMNNVLEVSWLQLCVKT